MKTWHKFLEATRRANYAIAPGRIIYTDGGSRNSTSAYITEFHNAMHQVRSIAYDGVRWFVQGGDRRSSYRQVSESEVPFEVRQRFAHYQLMKFLDLQNKDKNIEEFIKKIIEDPQDRTVKLVLADYYQDHDQEYIANRIRELVL